MTSRTFRQPSACRPADAWRLERRARSGAFRNLLDAVPSEAGLCLNDLKAAIADGDLARAKRAAHRLKGMAGNLGAARLAGAARGLEINTPTERLRRRSSKISNEP